MSDQSTLADLHEASGKVREMYGFGDADADGRLRPHLRVRRRPADADPRQGPGADRHVAVLVRAHRGTSSPNHLISAEPQRVPDPGPKDPELAGRSMLVAAADDAADRVRRARLPGRLRLEGLPGDRHGLRARAAAGPAAGRAAAAAAVHARHQGHRRPRREHRPRRRAWCSSASERYRRAGAGCRSTLYEAAAEYAADARDHHRRHQVRVRPRLDRPAGAGRRGADARLVAVLAGRRLRARHARRRRSTSSTCATGSRRSTGTRRRPAPSCPPRSSPARAARYLEAYERHHRRDVRRLPDEMGVRREGDGPRAAARRHPRSAGRGAAPVAGGARLPASRGARRQGVRPGARRRRPRRGPPPGRARSPSGCWRTR